MWQGCVCGRWACMAGGTCVVGGHAWWGACVAGGMHGRGACLVGVVGGVCVAGGVHGRGVCMAGKMAIPTGMHSCEKDLKCEGVSFAQ